MRLSTIKSDEPDSQLCGGSLLLFCSLVFSVVFFCGESGFAGNKQSDVLTEHASSKTDGYMGLDGAYAKGIQGKGAKKQVAASPPKKRKPSPRKKAPKRVKPNRWEWGGVGGPAFDADAGLIIGGIFHLAKFQEGFYPYRWMLRFTFLFSLLDTPRGLESPMHNYNLQLDLPGLLDGRLRITMNLGFSRNLNEPYFGLGNGTDGRRIWLDYDPEKQNAAFVRASRRYIYDHIFPDLQLGMRYQLYSKLFLFFNGAISRHWVFPYEGSKLEEDLKKGSSRNAPDSAESVLLYGGAPHNLIMLKAGILFDSRNEEFAPSSGGMHEVSARFSPGIALGTKYLFGGVNAVSRWYLSLWKDTLVFAVRGAIDFLWGQIPVYMLTSSGGLFESDKFGGESTIRGVRGGRLHGKLKTFANLELRWKLFHFFAGDTYMAFSTVAFFDIGRVWLDYGRFSSLDGDLPGLHFGTGGGIRFHWGKSLIIRLDVAWSPDANPVGVYFRMGHLF